MLPLTLFSLVCRYSKLKKKRSYEHDSVMDAVQMSIDNLRKGERTSGNIYTNILHYFEK